jgi:AraC-like DNA-binding protein
MGLGVHGERVAVESYRLPTLWALHCYRYDAQLMVNGQRLEVHPGTVTVFPPDTTIEYRYRGRSVHAYAHFTVATGQSRQRMPAVQVSPGVRLGLEEAIGWLPAHPLRAEIRLWDLLWQLAGTETRALPPPVAETLRLIELRLGGVIYVGDLAKTVGLSPNHLTRLFTAATGKGVATYIRDRRVERAVHLLRQSTLPIKAIAAEVGIPDLHLFNKCVRRALGVPPRRVRLVGRSAS